MNKNQVFINYIQEDQNIADKICRLLSEENISYTRMPFNEDMDSLLGMVQQIETTIQNSGAIIAIVSEKSMKNFRFISNVQYSCEKAVRRTVLAVYEINKTLDNPLELYYGQAAVINAINKADDYLDKLIENIKIILGHTDIPEQIRPKGQAQRMIKKIAIGMFSLALIAGASWIIVPTITGANLNAQQMIATPVVFDNPYSGESLDQGIVMDRRAAPLLVDQTNPQDQAPFHFIPSIIYRDFTFDEPSLDNILDRSVVNHYAGKITDEDKLIIQQDNGVLRYSIASQDNANHGDYWFPYSHLFNSEELQYLGIRFRVDTYQGWTDANQEITADFSFYGLDYYNGLGMINLSQQFLHAPNSVIDSNVDIGAHWHTLEYVPAADSNQLDIFLDGTLIGQSEELPNEPKLLNLVLTLQVNSSTDWVNFLVDEIIWGGPIPENRAENAADASYHFEPDEIIYHLTMDTLPIGDILDNKRYVTSVRNGTLNFELPGGESDHAVIFHLPAKPIDEMNYFAMRYRLTNYPLEYWSQWGQITMRYGDEELERKYGYNLFVAASRYTAEYITMYGQDQMEGISGSVEDMNYGDWHTMEMHIRPVSPTSDTYMLAYWFDDVLICERPISDVEAFTNANNGLFLRYSFESGSPNSYAFTGEIDEIIAGYINYFGEEN